MANLDAVKKGEADLTIVIAGTVGETVEIGEPKVQVEGELSRQSVIVNPDLTGINAVPSKALVVELGQREGTQGLKPTPSTIIHDRTAKHPSWLSENGLDKSARQLQCSVKNPILGPGGVKAVLRGNARSGSKEDRTVDLLVDANELPASGNLKWKESITKPERGRVRGHNSRLIQSKEGPCSCNRFVVPSGFEGLNWGLGQVRIGI